MPCHAILFLLFSEYILADEKVVDLENYNGQRDFIWGMLRILNCFLLSVFLSALERRLFLLFIHFSLFSHASSAGVKCTALLP